MPAPAMLSPGIQIIEKDLTTSASLPATNVGFFTGPFEQGPIEELVTIASETQLEAVFGPPNDYNYEYWFTVVQFLQYGGTMVISRCDNSNLKNAVDDIGSGEGAAAPKIKNLDNYEGNFETAVNSWKWAARTAGTQGNSLGVFVTDAGPDQILVVPAPASGNEHEFVADEAVSATSGAAGKVFKYSIVLTVDTIVGTFTPGATTTVDIGGSDESVNVLAWDPDNKKLEISLPGGSVTGILDDDQVITQGTNSAAINATIERRVYVALDKNSIEFAASDAIADTNSTSITVSSVRNEYAEREYVPGGKWQEIAQRPGTSLYANSKGGHRDELNILVVDVDGKITGTPGTLLERFIGLSKASDGKTSVGENNYYPEVIKQKSDYIYWGEHETDVFAATATSSDGDFGQAAEDRQFNLIRSAAGGKNYPGNQVAIGSANNSVYYYRLANGATYTVSGTVYDIDNNDLSSSYDLVNDRESVTVNYLPAGPLGNTAADALGKVTILTNLVELRKDCVAFISPRRGDVIGYTDPADITDNIVEFMKGVTSSSYLVIDSGYKYIYDKYNDKYRYIPCNADTAGLTLRTEIQFEPWFSPAGFNRGNLLNTIKLAFTPNKTQRDLLYANRINPIVTFPGQGTVLYGDKTALKFNSAFDRINVRKLFLALEAFVETAAKNILFEQNDEGTRASFLNVVEPYMTDVQGRRGVTDFLVKCDESNNPPEAVDRNEFAADIYVKPTRTINFVTLSFVATRTGVDFSEVVN
tara:strand:+ start:1933 stop:4203 length:2271 start_codon:yes stop_codon:yes gene_type:complete